MNPVFIATPGDPDGIGPEIVWKTIRSGFIREKRINLLCVGARAPFEKLGARVIEASDQLIPPKDTKPFVWLLPAPEKAPSLRGRRRHLAGYQSGWSIEKAVRLIEERKGRALITGPISKERLQAGGYPFPGHTEFLAHLCGVRHVTMMLANETLRVSMATTHIALKDVPRALTSALVKRTIMHTVDHLQRGWGIKKPRVAVAALNPHAGEAGLFGKEETRVIEPAIRSLRKTKGGAFELAGPLPADTLFAKHVMARPADRWDAVVCMYHDQGLIPVKLLDFPNTVNITLGLPLIRTSVDHGVGFDIAGTGKADPSSFRAALQMATSLAARSGSPSI